MLTSVTAAECEIVTVSARASPSFRARSVTVCAWFQSEVVKVSVDWSPAMSLSVSTATAVVSFEATVTTTFAPGSVSRTTV